MIEIDPKLREQAEYAMRKTLAFKDSEEYKVLAFRRQVIRDLLAAIDEHECLVSGVVSDELRRLLEDAERFLTGEDCLNWAHAIQDLLAIADAKPEEKQPCWVVKLSDEVTDVLSEEVVAAYKAMAESKSTGWQDGPPEEKGDYYYEDDEGNILWVQIKDVVNFHAMTANSCGCVRHYRVSIPPPPKREAVVEHKEGCPYVDYDFGKCTYDERPSWTFWDRPVWNCPGCGTKLPKGE